MDPLQRFLPEFHFDILETIFPVSLNAYTASQAVVPDHVTGVIEQIGEVTRLHYACFYLRDGGTKVLGLFDAGSHAFDLEMVTVDVVNDAVARVYFFPHGAAEWFCIEQNVNSILRDGHPQVFVARGKHGIYPVPGKIFRYLVLFDSCNIPTHRVLNLELASRNVMNTKYIADGMRGLSKHLQKDYDAVPRVRLAEVSTRMLFKLPSAL